MNNNFRTAAELVTRLFDSLDNEKFQQAGAFSKSWKTVVGDRIAAHSRIIDVDKGSIVVEVDHPGWGQQIQLARKRILSSLSSSFPELNIERLVIRDASKCSTPYIRNDTRIGEGIPREDIPEPDVPLNEDLDDPLQDVLKKLRTSIKKGKQR